MAKYRGFHSVEEVIETYFPNLARKLEEERIRKMNPEELGTYIVKKVIDSGRNKSGLVGIIN